MNTRSTLELKFLTWLKNRVIFLFMLVGLNLSCQHVNPKAKEQEANIQKIIDTNIAYAQKRMDEGDPEQALSALRPLLTNFPDNAPLLNMIGLTYLSMSRTAQAKVYFRRAYKKDKNPSYALNLSSALIMTNSYAEAERTLESHIKEKKYQYMERFYHNYALTFENRQNYQRAIEYYNKALDENPSYYLSNIRLGNIYKILHQKESALSSYESAYNSCKICFEPVSELCHLYIDAGELAKANEMLRGFLANKEITKEGREQAQKLLSLSSSKMNRTE